jgi:hypothetical protein
MHLAPSEIENLNDIFKSHKSKHRVIVEFLDGIKEHKGLSLSKLQIWSLQNVIATYQIRVSNPNMTREEFSRQYKFRRFQISESEAKNAEVVLKLDEL